MADLNLIRAEVAHMSEREILLELLAGQRVQNGALAEHHADLYGDKERNIVGTRTLADKHEIEIARARTTGRTILWFVGLLGGTNLLGFLYLWANHRPAP